MSDWKKVISASPSTVQIRDIQRYMTTNISPMSPIDYFYTERNELLRAIAPNSSNQNSSLNPLVLVGFIALTENYFREIFSGVIKLCPTAKTKSGSKSLNLATAWFGYGDLEKGAFENTSFADIKNIRKSLKELCNCDIDDAGQISAPLLEFEKLCELRHAIVHSAGLLAGKNASNLKLSRSERPVKISIGYGEVQEVAEVCTALVCSVNLELFQKLSSRWLHSWPNDAEYQGGNLNKVFKKIWQLFYSEIDRNLGLVQEPLSMVKTRNLIVRTNAA